MNDLFKENSPELYTAAFILANLPNQDIDWNDRIKSWNIVAKVHDVISQLKKQGINPTEENIEASVNKVKNLLQEGRTIDPTTFNGLTFIFEDYDPIYQEKINRYIKAGKSVLSVASVPASYIYPPAANALRVASAFVGDVLPYLSSPRLDLSVSPFPRELNYADLLELDKALLSYVVDRSNKEPLFKDVISRLSDNSTKINFNISSSDLLKSLPEEQQKVLKVSAENPENSSGQFLILMNTQLKRIEEQFSDWQTKMKAQIDEEKKKELIINKEREYQMLRSEFTSTFSLASMVLSPIFPELGEKFEKFGAAALQLMDLTKLGKVSNSIRPIALINGYASAVTLISSIIFDEGPDPFQTIIVKSLQRIENSIQELRQEIRFQFQIIEQRQIEILKKY